MQSYDYAVVGAGIMGLAVAWELKRRSPTARVVVLEKEDAPGRHASGRNSGVLHCGIYYGSDSLKAKLCASGAELMIRFAKEEGISYRRCGKVIVATSEEHLPALNKLLRNARENGIQAENIDSQQLGELEPHATRGPGAIYCPSTAVVDAPAVVIKLREKLDQQGVKFLFGCLVKGRQSAGVIKTNHGNIGFGYLINCAGAYADQLANSFGLAGDYALIPFKGIYWKLSSEANRLVRANIYPVPDARLPFLGVHFTRSINGDAYLGPTAIPALGRENYGLLHGARIGESLAIGSRLIAMYISNENDFRALAHSELSKYSKHCFFEHARKLVPELRLGDMSPTPKVGIRPQLINVRQKKLEMDYILSQTDESLHVLNAISPAFTSAFEFANVIVDKASAH